ncbi:Leucine-rich repeats and WD repeat domain-containing protein 1 [Actinomortierella wolfii]|nr:Leucine-rich repeats and WD repeat domain-containing protein 1 [Actinomortierella wolfii]
MALVHIIRAHSLATHDGQDDDTTDTAACAFEPVIKGRHGADDELEDEENGILKSSTVVATCGGNTVCLIDCQLGRIFAKYTHVEEEEFQCLAWTTLAQEVEDDDGANSGEDMDEEEHNQVPGKRQRHFVNILAAAGRLGSIKLINPLQNTCYRYLHGHTAEVVQLGFSLNNPQWLYSASADKTIRLWDIGSVDKEGQEPRCLAKLEGLESPVTSMAVSEKYLVAGTEAGDMARFNIRALELKIRVRQTSSSSGPSNLVHWQPDRIFPNSQEWHESTVDDIVYLPKFSSKSFFGGEEDAGHRTKVESSGKKKGASRKGVAANSSKSRRGRGRKRAKESSDDEDVEGSGEDSDYGDDDDDDDDDTEYIFASHESHQGEILIWDATSSTETDAELKTILEWPISESQTRFSFAQNVAVQGTTPSSVEAERKQSRQNVLIVGSTTGEILLYDLNIKPKYSKGNIVAQKPTRILSSPMSTQLLRHITASKDLSTIVAGDWTNRVLIWKYPSYLDV